MRKAGAILNSPSPPSPGTWHLALGAMHFALCHPLLRLSWRAKLLRRLLRPFVAIHPKIRVIRATRRARAPSRQVRWDLPPVGNAPEPDAKLPGIWTPGSARAFARWSSVPHGGIRGQKTAFSQLSQLSQLFCVNLGLFAKVAKVATFFLFSRSCNLLPLVVRALRFTLCALPFTPTCLSPIVTPAQTAGAGCSSRRPPCCLHARRRQRSGECLPPGQSQPAPPPCRAKQTDSSG